MLYHKIMGIKEDLKSLIAKEAKTMTEIAGILYKTDNKRTAMNSLSQKLRLNTIKYEEVRQIADLLGYDIQFVKRK